MNAVRAAHHGRVLEFQSTPLQNFREPLQISKDERGSLFDLQRLCSINHVIRGEAVMQPARLRPHFLGDGCGEGDDIVPYLGFDLVNALNAEVCFFANSASGLRRHEAGFGKSFGGRDFHRQPHTKLVFVAPDAPHFRAGISRDQ